MAPAPPRLRILSGEPRFPSSPALLLKAADMANAGILLFYNLSDIIQSVVTPQHTCVLVNATNTLGVERHLEERFPTNVVLSLVSGADLTQLGSSEFEHSGSTEVWVGPANVNSSIPEAIQQDMSEALAMTLTTGQVDCKVSTNIRQQQYERMIGCVSIQPNVNLGTDYE